MKITKSTVTRIELTDIDTNDDLYEVLGDLTPDNRVRIVDGALESYSVSQ